jgi:hypothetical protein
MYSVKDALKLTCFFGVVDKLGVQGKKVKSNNDLEVILYFFLNILGLISLLVV